MRGGHGPDTPSVKRVNDHERSGTQSGRRNRARPRCCGSSDRRAGRRPTATHLYWMLGGTWGLHSLAGASDEVATKGVRVVAGVVVLLLVAGGWSSWRGSGCGSRRSCPTARFGSSPGRWRRSSWSRQWQPSPGAGGPSGGCMGRSRSCSECWHWLSPARGKRGFVFVGHTGCSRPTDGEHIARPDRRLGDPGVNATQ
jgi:hypothetical protein